MSTILGMLPAFGLYWLILFVACFAVVEYGQTYLYEEATPSAGLRVTGGSALIAALLVWTRTEFFTMFTADIFQTTILAVVAFAVFALIFQFQPWHALPIGVITVLLFSGMASMAVQSFGDPVASTATQRPSKPVRGSTKITPTPVLPGSTDPAKKSEPAMK